MKLTILTNDPSITAWGWAVIQDGKAVATGCIKTNPEHKKMRIRKSDDTTRRIQAINEVLLEQIEKYHVDYLLSEAPHGSQSASAAVMIGIVTGIVQTLSDALRIPLEWYSEDDAKQTMLGKRSAGKDEMILSVDRKYPGEFPWKGVEFRDEAVADAMAIYYTALKQSNTLKLMR